MREDKKTYFENLRKGFDDPCIFITIHLNGVYQRDLCLCAVTERFQYISEVL